MDRRKFLKTLGLGAAGIATATAIGNPPEKSKTDKPEFNPMWIISPGTDGKVDAQELLTGMSNTKSGALIITREQKAVLDQDFMPLDEWLKSHNKWSDEPEETDPPKNIY